MTQLLNDPQFEDLPWRNLQVDLTRQYRRIVTEVYGDSEEIYPLLIDMEVTSFVYNPDQDKDLAVAPFWQWVLVELTKMLQATLLENPYNLPEEIAKAMFVTQIGQMWMTASERHKRCGIWLDCDGDGIAEKWCD